MLESSCQAVPCSARPSLSWLDDSTFCKAIHEPATYSSRVGTHLAHRPPVFKTPRRIASVLKLVSVSARYIIVLCPEKKTIAGTVANEVRIGAPRDSA